MMTTHPSEHPERALISQLLAAPRSNVPVTTNPLAIALDMHIDDCRPGYLKARFNATLAFTQGNGDVQGGIIAAMLDFGMIFAAFSYIDAGHTLASISQTTNYFRPAHAGVFTVEAELERAGRTLINARATLYNAEGKATASASSPIAIVMQRHED